MTITIEPKLSKNARLRFYELICVFRQDISSVDLENIKKDLISLITSYNGKIDEQDVKYIGLKSLAYQIKKNTKGNYMIFGFQADNRECLLELDRKLKLSPEIIRYLVKKVDKFDFSASDLFKSFVVAENATAVDVTIGNQKVRAGTMPQAAVTTTDLNK